MASKSSRVRATRARPAMAIRWISALVEPPSASTVAAASSNASRVRIVAGVLSCQTMSTMRLPESTAIRQWAESTAGIDAAPGSVMPSASAALVIVEAVPIVMQWPGERAMPFFEVLHSQSVTDAGPVVVPEPPHVGAAAELAAAVVAAEHRARPGRRSPGCSRPPRP